MFFKLLVFSPPIDASSAGKLILSVKNALSSNDLVHRKIGKMFKNQEQAVIGMLAYEKLKGNASLWAPYFDILPQYVSNFAFSGFLSNELQSEKLERDAVNTLSQLRADFKVFQKTVKPSWPKAVPAPSLDTYQWASSIIDSRALRFEGNVNLIPIADIFNYAPHPVPRRKNSGNFFLQHHKLTDKGLVVTSDRDCARGQQLFEDYGDNEDGIYAQFHGFVANENPFRCSEYKADFTSDMADKPDSLRHLFRSLKINSDMRKCIDASGDVGLGLIVYESALAFDQAEIDTCEVAIEEKKGDWNAIFERCGFSQVQGELNQFLTRRASAAGGGGGGEGEEEGEDDYVDDSLFSRFLGGVQARLTAYVRAQPTTLAYDEDLLAKITDELRFSSTDKDSPFAQEKNLDKLSLSVRYRVAMKRHLTGLCCMYRAACCPRMAAEGGAAAATEAAAASPAAGTGAGAAKDPLYRSVDWGSATIEEKLAIFGEWFDAAGPQVNKLRAALIPGFRVGTQAREGIAAGEVYLTVPARLIMDADKAVAEGSGVGSLLRQMSGKHGNRDNFHEVLFFLLFEYFSGGPDSYYWPYLALLPRPAEMDIPLLWAGDGDVARRLGPSAIRSSVETYRSSVRNSFDKMSKIGFIRKFFGLDAPDDYGVVGGASILTFENYRWATAVLDSRSIWWGGLRHLVPLLDLVNCAQGPPTHQVHSTSLSESGQHAVTKAGWGFEAGEQVFEQYGQPNHIYFMYHGFVLPSNSFDCVNMELGISEGEAGRVHWKTHRGLLQKLGMRDAASVFRHCVKETVSEALWVFLALKLNQVDEMIKRSELGAPNKNTATLLAGLLEDKMQEYQTFFTANGMDVLSEGPEEAGSVKFLRSEYAALGRSAESVRTILSKMQGQGQGEL
jgi:hypothetical protein